MAYEASLGLVAMTRFGYGPHGDGDTAIAASDPRGFLAAELAEPGIALLGGPGLPTSVAAAQMFYRDAAERRAERDRAAAARERTKQYAELAAISPVFADAAAAEGLAMPSSPGEGTTRLLRPAAAARPEGIVFRDEALARLRRATAARAGFAERLVAFWSNHFCVAANKGGIGRVTCGAFEREAIRSEEHTSELSHSGESRMPSSA